MNRVRLSISANSPLTLIPTARVAAAADPYTPGWASRRNGHGGLGERLRSRAGIPVRASGGPRVCLDANLFSAAQLTRDSRPDAGRIYAFESPRKLFRDFQSEVERILVEMGVGPNPVQVRRRK